MANEGSTKQYSELERKIGLCEATIEEQLKERSAVYVELARVRGLLQRRWISVEERLPEHGSSAIVAQPDFSGGHSQAIARYYFDDGWYQGEHKLTTVTHWQPLPVPQNFRESSSLVSQGAESADIGKLDAADKSGLQMWAAVEMFEDDWDEPRPLWEDLPEADRNSYIKMAGAALRVFKVSQMSPKELDATLAGSAETGGEKAAWIPIDPAPPSLVKLLASMDYTLPDDAKEVANQLRAIAWQPIDSAPKTGEHILVAVFDGGIGFGTCGGKKQAWAGVVHYWEHDEPGWYMSTANGDIRVEPTHWQEISELDGANFPRASQNQTVSSGVEGAHEGAAADKSGSREPEKLNNAQKAVSYESLLGAMREYVIDQKECGNPATRKDLREFRSWKNMPQDDKFDRALLEEINVPALAESSLSQKCDGCPRPDCPCAPACTATEHTEDCKKTGECDRVDDYETGVKERPESSLSSPPPPDPPNLPSQE